MNIEIHDPELEKMIQQQLKATGSSSIEDLLRTLLADKQEQDRWLAENREAINLKIQRGLAELDRGEGIPESQARQYIADLKSKAQ